VDDAVKAGAERIRRASARSESAALDAVTAAIDSLRFGTVLVTVHEGKVVQIDTTERRRFS